MLFCSRDALRCAAEALVSHPLLRQFNSQSLVQLGQSIKSNAEVQSSVACKDCFPCAFVILCCWKVHCYHLTCCKDLSATHCTPCYLAVVNLMFEQTVSSCTSLILAVHSGHSELNHFLILSIQRGVIPFSMS